VGTPGVPYGHCTSETRYTDIPSEMDMDMDGVQLIGLDDQVFSLFDPTPVPYGPVDYILLSRFTSASLVCVYGIMMDEHG